MRGVCLILFLITPSLLLAQQSEVDFNKLKYKNISMWSSREDIISNLGEPKREFEPNYECGYLSSEWQGEPFYSLEYKGLVFTGNESQGYVLEKLELSDGVKFLYGESEISNNSSIERLSVLFETEELRALSKNFSGAFVLFAKSEDGIRLHFANGKLVRLSYLSPC